MHIHYNNYYTHTHVHVYALILLLLYCFSGEDLSYLFSSCSIDRLTLLTRVKLGQCLATGQPANDIYYPQRCGNGIIERGEQCDCGPRGVST